MAIRRLHNVPTYTAKPPGASYLQQLLVSDGFIAHVALHSKLGICEDVLHSDIAVK